jgi:hypothetical protein
LPSVTPRPSDPRAAPGRIRPRGSARRSRSCRRRCRQRGCRGRGPCAASWPARHGALTVRETLESLLCQNVYVSGDRTTGRDKIRDGHRICFYSSGVGVGVGVVADAEIAGSAERRGVVFAKDATRCPWAFAVRDVRFCFDAPVAIDAALRSQLDAFIKHGHDPNGPWSRLVQGTRYLTEHDFAVLTRR